jgi:hypothetical protein
VGHASAGPHTCTHRSAIAVKPKQRFLDLLHAFEPTTVETTLRDMCQDLAIFLIPESGILLPCVGSCDVASLCSLITTVTWPKMSEMDDYFDNGISIIRTYAAYENARRRSECERLSRLVTTVPIVDSVFQEVVQLSPDDFAQVMRFSSRRWTQSQDRVVVGIAARFPYRLRSLDIQHSRLCYL